MKTMLVTVIACIALSIPVIDDAVAEIMSVGEGENLETVGRWAEGPCLSVAARNDTAYFANGAWLEIIDFTDAGMPLLIGKLLLPSAMNGVDLHSELLYSACGGGGLRIIDISDPDSPQEIGFIDSYPRGDPDAKEVHVQDGIAYIANGVWGLWIIDVSDPTAPHAIYDDYQGRDYYDISIAGNYAYLAGGANSLVVVDVSIPSDPVEIGGLHLIGYCDDLFIDGNIAYLATGFGLITVDIASPAVPAVLEVTDLGAIANDVYVIHDLAYVVDNARGLWVFDVTNPSEPTKLYQGELEDEAYVLEADESRCYLAQRAAGVGILDITQPSSPVSLGSYATYGSAKDLAVQNGYAYLLTSDAGLVILDISEELWSRVVYDPSSSDILHPVDEHDSIYHLPKQRIAAEFPPSLLRTAA